MMPQIHAALSFTLVLVGSGGRHPGLILCKGVDITIVRSVNIVPLRHVCARLLTSPVLTSG